MGFTTFLLKPKANKSADPSSTLSNAPDNTSIQPESDASEPSAAERMLHFAAIGRTKPLSFQEAYEDLIMLNQRHAFMLSDDVDLSHSAVSWASRRIPHFTVLLTNVLA